MANIDSRTRGPGDGQRSQNSGDDRKTPLVEYWWEIPASTLWRFTSELCARLSYRRAEEKTGVSKEALRKYVEGLTAPNRTTRQKLGELFLETYPGGYMAKKDIFGDWDVRPRLIELLPDDMDQAREQLAKLFELAKRFPDEVPDFVDQVQRWIDLQVTGEHEALARHASFASRQREWKRESRELREKIRKAREAGTLQLPGWPDGEEDGT